MNSYVVEYSESKNRSMLLKSQGIVGLFGIIFMLGLIYLNLSYHQNNILVVIIIFSFVYVLFFVIYGLSNYLNNKKYMRQYQVAVAGNNISVNNALLDSKINFAFQDIVEVVTITFGITIFCATQLNLVGGKRVIVSNATNNYDLFLNDLVTKTNLSKKHVFKPTGSWVENIY
jgi:hypothetical protein